MFSVLAVALKKTALCSYLWTPQEPIE